MGRPHRMPKAICNQHHSGSSSTSSSESSSDSSGTGTAEDAEIKGGVADDEDVKGEESEGEESEMEDVEESEMEDVEDEVGACVEVKGGDANQEDSASGETMQGDWLEAAVFKHPKFKQMSFDFDDLGQSLQRPEKHCDDIEQQLQEKKAEIEQKDRMIAHLSAQVAQLQGAKLEALSVGLHCCIVFLRVKNRPPSLRENSSCFDFKPVYTRW